ncbi:TPA: hypothetical protein MF132_12970 [Klebsiella pneumoniae]|nr:hypothetical protein [Klebsiella pneumoniae]HBX0778093.1 hypothetical protein [Klebsiella pneumoniae]HBX0800096.1 hypothetical protein [Klebsiella pneumoniae]HBX0847902.1 hypothetical protein [Klebsiella pneumoniae]HBX0890704.1 hypothetical protein [Klebsiella pneumoniae]
MTITLEAVNELIASLESAGELSIREQKFLKLAKAFKQLAAENVALKSKGKELLGEACAVYSRLNKMIDPSIGDFVDGQTLHEFQFVLDAETPATDRIVAGIKADGVEEFLKGSQLPYQIATVLADYDNADDETLLHVIWSGQPPEPEGDVWHLEYVSRGNAIVREVLKQLRDGADK